MKLEYANLICPKCGNGNYMRHLVGKNVGELNVKCINCNSYFKLSHFYRMTGKAEPQPLTNSDRFRQMTDEELADFHVGMGCPPGIDVYEKCHDIGAVPPVCLKCWMDWLKSPAADKEGEG